MKTIMCLWYRENILKMNYIVKPRIFKFLLTNHEFALASLFYVAWSLHITPLQTDTNSTLDLQNHILHVGFEGKLPLKMPFPIILVSLSPPCPILRTCNHVGNTQMELCSEFPFCLRLKAFLVFFVLINTLCKIYSKYLSEAHGLTHCLCLSLSLTDRHVKLWVLQNPILSDQLKKRGGLLLPLQPCVPHC